MSAETTHVHAEGAGHGDHEGMTKKKIMESVIHIMWNNRY